MDFFFFGREGWSREECTSNTLMIDDRPFMFPMECSIGQFDPVPIARRTPNINQKGLKK